MSHKHISQQKSNFNNEQESLHGFQNILAYILVPGVTKWNAHPVVLFGSEEVGEKKGMLGDGRYSWKRQNAVPPKRTG